MKNIYLFLLFLGTIAQAQTPIAPPPQGISHRGTVYNTSGVLVVNAPVKIRIQILDNGTTGVYTELHQVTTNAQGQYSLNIGTGTQIYPTTPPTGGFSALNWGLNLKWLKVEIDPTNVGTTYPITGTNQLMSVPYALYSNATNPDNSMKVVNILNDLRSIEGKAGDVIYVKGHTTPGDGGGGNFIWSTHPYTTSTNITVTVNSVAGQSIPSPYYTDNDGTVIWALSTTGTLLNTGRWIRQYEGYINVRYFGAFGQNTFDTDRIKKAIDFAYANGSIYESLTKGTTVYFPNGSYIVDKINIRNGVALLGDSFDKTILISTITGDPGYTSGYLFDMDTGVVQMTMANFNILGRDTAKGCFYLNAQPGGGGGGGIWNSAFKNIKIRDFLGHNLFIRGVSTGPDDYNVPNQFLTFENVRVTRKGDNGTSLKILGLAGQMTFLNCLFEGSKTGEEETRSKNANVEIGQADGHAPSVISFINSSFQDSDYGVILDFATNVTFDNCWFESLGIGIRADGTNGECKSINIVNNFFANASGFGSLTALGNITSSGRCIDVINSQVNVMNNFVRVSDEHSSLINDDFFILANNTNVGVTVQGNSFLSPVLGKTYGITAIVTSVVSNVLDCRNNKELFVNSSSFTTPSAVLIKEIKSDILAGETLFVRANNGNVTFYDASNPLNTVTDRNIYLTGKSSLTLSSGDVAIFTKIDTSPATYQLTSIIRPTTP